MPIGTQTVTDNFDRADQNPIAGNWTGDGGLKLLSNSVTAVALGSDGIAYYNPWIGGDNQYSQVEITENSQNPDSGFGVMVRKASGATATYYRLTFDSQDGILDLSTIIGGSYTQIATRTVTYGAGQKLGLNVNSSTLQIWYNGAQVGADVINADIATGFPGIVFSSPAVSGSMDNWDAGTVGVVSVYSGLFTA